MLNIFGWKTSFTSRWLVSLKFFGFDLYNLLQVLNKKHFLSTPVASFHGVNGSLVLEVFGARFFPIPGKPNKFFDICAMFSCQYLRGCIIFIEAKSYISIHIP